MKRIPSILITSAMLIGLSASLAPAADSLEDGLKDFRKARGQAIAKENQNFLRWLEGALNQARAQNKQAEAARLESLMEQLRAESAALLAKGDQLALLPTNAAQLRAHLIGTAWHPNKKASDARVFTEDGQFKTKNAAIPYSVVGPRRVNLVWSASTRIDCEFNEDFTEMKELGGLGTVWKLVP